MDIWMQDFGHIEEANDNNKSAFESKSDDYEYVNEVSDHLICNVCFSPIYIPRLLTCGHVFCQSCIQSTINHNGRKCPQCSQRVCCLIYESITITPTNNHFYLV